MPWPGDDRRIVERGHEGAPLFRRDVLRTGERTRETVAFDDDAGVMVRGARDLRERRARRHDDRGGDAELVRVVGDALGVVAGRRRDDARRPGLGCEAGEEVAGTRAP